MRLYFLFGLAISVLLALALFRVLINRLHVNWNNLNHIRLGFLLPILITILLIWTITSQVVPKMLDLVNVVSVNYLDREITLRQTDIHYNRIQVDDQSYYFNPLRLTVDPAVDYRMFYLPNSHFIMGFELVNNPEQNIDGEARPPADETGETVTNNTQNGTN